MLNVRIPNHRRAIGLEKGLTDSKDAEEKEQTSEHGGGRRDPLAQVAVEREIGCMWGSVPVCGEASSA